MLKFFRVNPWALSLFKGSLTKLNNCLANGGALKEYLMADMQVQSNNPKFIFHLVHFEIFFKY